MRRAHAAVGLLLAGLCALAACNQDKRLLWEKPSQGGEGGGDIIIVESGGGGDEPQPPPLGGAPPFPVMACEPAVPCECMTQGECVCMPPPNEPMGQCLMGCDSSYCNMVCSQGTSCDMSCVEGCTMVCEPFSICDLSCEGGCDVVCGTGAICTLLSFGAPSQIYCEAGAMCECPIASNCTCFGPGCPPEPPPMP